MKKKYYVSTRPQNNGDHEMHVDDCVWLPVSQNRIYLGEFTSCKDAVNEARKYYRQTNGCKYCSRACHTQ